MRIKGRYVAQIVIDFDIKKQEGMSPLGELRKTVDGELANAIRDVVIGEIMDGYGTVTVTQQYADLYEVEDGDTD